MKEILTKIINKVTLNLNKYLIKKYSLYCKFGKSKNHQNKYAWLSCILFFFCSPHIENNSFWLSLFYNKFNVLTNYMLILIFFRKIGLLNTIMIASSLYSHSLLCFHITTWTVNEEIINILESNIFHHRKRIFMYNYHLTCSFFAPSWLKL